MIRAKPEGINNKLMETCLPRFFGRFFFVNIYIYIYIYIRVGKVIKLSIILRKAETTINLTNHN